MPITAPLLSSQRLKTELANAVNRHSNSSASARSAFAIWSTIARRCVSRSPTNAFRFCQSMKEWDRAMVVSRLRTCFATSPGLCAPANSSRSRRLVAALSVLTSISNSARRVAPRAARFFALRVLFEATRESRSHNSSGGSTNHIVHALYQDGRVGANAEMKRKIEVLEGPRRRRRRASTGSCP